MKRFAFVVLLCCCALAGPALGNGVITGNYSSIAAVADGYSTGGDTSPVPLDSVTKLLFWGPGFTNVSASTNETDGQVFLGSAQAEGRAKIAALGGTDDWTSLRLMPGGQGGQNRWTTATASLGSGQNNAMSAAAVFTTLNVDFTLNAPHAFELSHSGAVNNLRGSPGAFLDYQLTALDGRTSPLIMQGNLDLGDLINQGYNHSDDCGGAVLAPGKYSLLVQHGSTAIALGGGDSAISNRMMSEFSITQVQQDVVPEPLTLLAVASAVTGLGGYIRRRMR
jgi:hypothetical protein